jgi:hypothetical protein
MALSSKTVAAEDICDRDGEEAEPEGEQDQVQHWLLLAVAFCQPSSDPNAPETLMRLKADGCFAGGYLSSAAYEIERGGGAIV